MNFNIDNENKEKKFKFSSIKTSTSENKLKHSSNFSNLFFLKKSKFKFLNDFEISLYSTLKETVPIIDAAITKIIRLVGSFKIECINKKTEIELNNFFETIKVGPTSMGIDSFIFSYLNQLLTYGTSIGEIVLDTKLKKIIALYNASLKDVYLKSGENILEVSIYTKSKTNTLIPVKFPELIFISTLNPEPGQIYGNSIMTGLPFLSGILLKIYETIGLNWDRIANTRFAVSYLPPQNSINDVNIITKERVKSVADQWSRAANSIDPTDFVAIGDVNVKVIGADAQVIDSRVPVRQLLEQILSKLSIPPFLLGLSWSTTETMSEQQSDILTGELESYRRILNPVIRKICSYYLFLKGIDEEFNIIWETVKLKDKLRSAQTKLLETKSEILLKNNNLI